MINRGSTPACVIAATSAGVAGPGATGRPSWAEIFARLRASMSSRLLPVGTLATSPFGAQAGARWAYDDERQPVAASTSRARAHAQVARFIRECAFIDAASD